jgi:hypothetical protein
MQMPESREIKAVIAVVVNPTGKDDPGQCAEGWYFVENGTLTLTDRDGIPLRDENNGQRITVRLLPGESEKTVAKRMTLRQHRAANRDEMAGFHRSIRYPSRGWA